MQIKWSKDEDEVLKKYYTTGGYKECQKYLNRSKYAISGRAWILGIKTNTYIINEKVFETIKNMMQIDKKTVTEIGKELNISRHAIYEYFKRRDLKVTDFYTTDRQFIRLPKENQGWVCIYKSYKKTAEKRNLKFELSLEQLKTITSSNCIYCDSQPSMIAPRKLYTYKYNGIDRKNNNVGYTLENSLPCCNFCNFMKSTYSETEFLEQINKIYNFRMKK